MELSPDEKDILVEVASVGSGNASAAMSNLVNKQIDLVTPSMDLVAIKEIPKFIGGPKKMVIGSYTPIGGDLTGNMLAIFEKKNAFLLVDLILKKELGTTKQIGTEEKKALNQMSLSLSIAYLTAIEEFLELNITKANSRFIATFGSNIVDFITLNIRKEDNVILLKTEFNIEPDVKGNFILLLAIPSVEALVELLKKKVMG